MGDPTPHKKHKDTNVFQQKIQKCYKMGLYVSYRAENLHAEIFFTVIRVLYRSKVSKVSKIINFDDFLNRCWRSSGADSMAPWVPHSGLGRFTLGLPAIQPVAGWPGVRGEIGHVVS